MKLKLGISVLALVCSVTVFSQDQVQIELPAQPRSGFPTDDTAYKSSYRPKPVSIGPNMRIKDDAVARREWMKERMGGPLTADFRDAMLAEVAGVRAAYPNAYNPGAVHQCAAGTWTNIGPCGRTGSRTACASRSPTRAACARSWRTPRIPTSCTC